MKLIKLSEEHYIVVDESEIKEGDFIYSSDGGIFKRHIDNPCQTIFPISKVTHSTNIDWHEVYYIPLSEVKELLGEVDVDNIVDELSEKPHYTHSSQQEWFKIGAYSGYNQALEDNKEKKYTERDLWRAFDSGKAGKMALEFYETLFQPKTEWDVEFDEHGKLKLI